MQQLKPQDYQGTLATSIREEGIDVGLARSVLGILHLRDVPVSEDDHERITTCVDAAHLNTWLQRALTATHADDLFRDGEQ